MNLRHQKNLNRRYYIMKMKIDKILEMPTEVCTNMPKITIIGFNELILENYKGIL